LTGAKKEHEQYTPNDKHTHPNHEFYEDRTCLNTPADPQPAKDDKLFLYKSLVLSWESPLTISPNRPLTGSVGIKTFYRAVLFKELITVGDRLIKELEAKFGDITSHEFIAKLSEEQHRALKELEDATQRKDEKPGYYG